MITKNLGNKLGIGLLASFLTFGNIGKAQTPPLQTISDTPSYPTLSEKPTPYKVIGNEMKMQYIPREIDELKSIWQPSEDDNYLANIIEKRASRGIETRFFSGRSKLDQTFRFFSSQNRIGYLSSLNYDTRLGRSALQSAGEEALRSWATHTFHIGGFIGEAIESLESNSISSPFNYQREGDPGLVSNKKTKNHFKLNLFDTNPYSSFKHHFGEQTQLNIRADMNGAEAIISQELMPNLNLVAGARMGDYTYDHSKVYLGLNYSRSKTELLQFGATLTNNLASNDGHKENGRGLLASVTYTRIF